MSRLAFLRMLGLAPMARYGSQGQMHRRPDQQTDAPPSAVAPTQAAGIVRARLVLIFGTGANTGLFVYNGSPGLGNLVASIAPPGVTKDPYGNSVDPVIASYSGLNTAILSASALSLFAGITERATLSTSHFTVFNSSGATIYDVDLTRTAQFLYADTGSASQGALIGSDAPGAGTDQFGNAYLAGTTVYASVGSPLTAARHLETGISYRTATTPAGPWNAVASVDYVTAAPAHLDIGGGVTRVDLNATTIAAYANVQSAPGGALEIWHVVGAGGQPPFLNSFSAGGTAPRFQLEPIGGGRVRLSGAVNTGAVTGANTAIFNLPAAYRPARNLNFVTQNNVTAYTLGSSSIQVTTGGDVQLVPAGTAGKFVVLDGICFELD